MHVIEATEDVSQFIKGKSGPAAQVELHSNNGKVEKFVVYANHPELNIQHAQEHGTGPVIHYAGAQQRMYTGLQVAKDPGVEIVWLGCLLMVIGIYIAFFMSHRRIWIRIQAGSITVAGNASKNQGAFQQFFETVAKQIKTEVAGGSV
jgi:cytochrome c biogenesis protein